MFLLYGRTVRAEYSVSRTFSMQAQHGFVRIKYKLIIIFVNVFVASLALCNLSDTFRWSVGSGGIRLIIMIQQGYRQRWAHGELKR